MFDVKAFYLIIIHCRDYNKRQVPFSDGNVRFNKQVKFQ